MFGACHTMYGQLPQTVPAARLRAMTPEGLMDAKLVVETMDAAAGGTLREVENSPKPTLSEWARALYLLQTRPAATTTTISPKDFDFKEGDQIAVDFSAYPHKTAKSGGTTSRVSVLYAQVTAAGLLPVPGGDVNFTHLQKSHLDRGMSYLTTHAVVSLTIEVNEITWQFLRGD